jgi:hypothetical protein
MLILLCNADGLTVGDTETGLTAYAYPTSNWHYRATRYPSSLWYVARDMIDAELENAWTRNPATLLGRELMARDAETLARLSKDANTRRFDVSPEGVQSAA